ncbi:MAG TPA: transketolase C-terminal domain-containing protein, partial [Rhodocyclaceae bacterium]|nr:transketolase C-terminal domain-containing protein [Rhodocyclaceae bacterium]
NQAAKARFMFGGQCSVPMVVRTPHGGGLNAGPQHSQCLEAWFAHVPGLKVVVPSNAADAYGLLRAAIIDPDPVIYVENKALYSAKSPVPETLAIVPIGRAATLRPGRDVTVVAYGIAVRQALAAAQTLAAEGIEAEIIDLRSIQPWDRQSVLDSVRRTGRLVIAHEAVTAFGVGAEIAAWIGEQAFDSLRAPIGRVGSAFMPTPFAKSLERHCVPADTHVVAAVRRAVAYQSSRSHS